MQQRRLHIVTRSAPRPHVRRSILHRSVRMQTFYWVTRTRSNSYSYTSFYSHAAPNPIPCSKQFGFPHPLARSPPPPPPPPTSRVLTLTPSRLVSWIFCRDAQFVARKSDQQGDGIERPEKHSHIDLQFWRHNHGRTLPQVPHHNDNCLACEH